MYIQPIEIVDDVSVKPGHACQNGPFNVDDCVHDDSQAYRVQARLAVEELLEGYRFTVQGWSGWEFRLNTSCYSPNRYEVHGTPLTGAYRGVEIAFACDARLDDLHAGLDNFQAQFSVDGLDITGLPPVRVPELVLNRVLHHHTNPAMQRFIPLRCRDQI